LQWNATTINGKTTIQQNQTGHLLASQTTFNAMNVAEELALGVPVTSFNDQSITWTIIPGPSGLIADPGYTIVR
jgi:hypothetical protein